MMKLTLVDGQATVLHGVAADGTTLTVDAATS